MKVVKDIMSIIKDPFKIVRKLNNLGYLKFISDETYIKWDYYNYFNEKLELNNPKKFSEKIQWLKLNERNSLITKCADKYLVREFVEEMIGAEYLNETISVHDNADEINIDLLPEKFVIKANHSSGHVLLVNNKNKLNWNLEKTIVNKWLKDDYSLHARQWGYKNIDRKIIVEKFLENDNNDDLIDYKIFCFNGNPDFIQITSDRKGSEFYIDHFDTEWNSLNVQRKGIDKSKIPITKPEKLEEMIDLAKVLSSPFKFVRVDFYQVNKQIIFGELTFYPGGGLSRYEPKNFDKIIGKKLIL